MTVFVILPSRLETRYTRAMDPRIQLDESHSDTPVGQIPVTSPPPATARHLLDADWESSEGDPLMLYVAEEPRVGLEFSYNGVSNAPVFDGQEDEASMVVQNFGSGIGNGIGIG